MAGTRIERGDTPLDRNIIRRESGGRCGAKWGGRAYPRAEGLAVHPGGSYIDATVGLGGHSAAIIEAASPGGRLLGIDRDDVPGAGERVSLGVLERVGVYRMSVDGEPIAAVAVNLDSRTERMLGSVDAVTIGGENLASTGGGAEPREVWHWFVLGAMVILTCEWLLNAAQMRV